MPRFAGTRERKEAHVFDTVKLAGTDHVPAQHGRLFDFVYDGKPDVTGQRPPSDCTFLLEQVQVEVRGESREDCKILEDGVRFYLHVGESPWQVRGATEEEGGREGVYGDKFIPTREDSQSNVVYIPARQSFGVYYDLSDAALRVLATKKDAGLRFHLLGHFMRDVA